MAVSTPHLAITHTIDLEWDNSNPGYIKTPIQPTMNVGDSVTVTSSYRSAMIKFLSPFGDPIATVKAGEVVTFQVGGIYQFDCYIDGKKAKNGGGVEIIPHQP
ncbi:MAG TPA: hypothetical protein VFF39_19495 [Verrucomicrobiae bacterium]|jgi:hypothetical protein|nr:hypothetical protein [Verrucomicrobiae bacterium]